MKKSVQDRLTTATDGLEALEGGAGARGGIMAAEVSMQFQVTVDRDEDGVWIVECPAIPGCVTQGATREQALANVKDAIRECLHVRAERGLPLTVETQLVEVVA
jgi:predicted RNase H-like HicB family nuclease